MIMITKTYNNNTNTEVYTQRRRLRLRFVSSLPSASNKGLSTHMFCSTCVIIECTPLRVHLCSSPDAYGQLLAKNYPTEISQGSILRGIPLFGSFAAEKQELNQRLGQTITDLGRETPFFPRSCASICFHTTRLSLSTSSVVNNEMTRTARLCIEILHVFPRLSSTSLERGPLENKPLEDLGEEHLGREIRRSMCASQCNVPLVATLWVHRAHIASITGR